MSDCSQDVFQLRKDGKFDEALAAGRQCLAQSPADEWAQRALGWVLHSLAVRALGHGDAEAARAYSVELDGLSAMETDEMLGPKMRGLRDQVSSGGHYLVKAREAEEKGRFDEAVRLYQQALEEDPSNDRVKVSCGWAIRNQLKEAVRREPCDIRRVDSLVRQFARLDPPRAELVSQLVLSDLASVADRYEPFFGFATRWFGLAHLADSEYMPVRKASTIGSRALSKRLHEAGKSFGNSTSYPGLGTKVVKAVAKSAIKKANPEEALAILPFLDKAIRYAEEDFWLTYHKGKLLLRGEKPEAAREFLLPIVRAKRTDSWAWAILAHTYSNDEAQKAIACLCKAVEVERDELYLSNIRMELARLLSADGEVAAASFELATIKQFKENAGQRFPAELTQLLDSEWFDASSAPASNQPTYDRFSPIAEAVLIDGLPEYRAFVVRHQAKSDKGPARSFVAYEVREGAQSEVAVKRLPGLKDLAPGHPISIVADVATDPVSVLTWEPREGDPWDLVPIEIGVVEHVNANKNVSRVVLGPRRDALFYHDLCTDASGWAPGSVLAVRAVPSEPGRPMRVVNAQRTKENPPAAICRETEGRFEVPSRLLEENPLGPWDYGFVSNAYVHRSLIRQTEGLEDGDCVRIVAVSSGKGDGKWSVVQLDRVAYPTDPT